MSTMVSPVPSPVSDKQVRCMLQLVGAAVVWPLALTALNAGMRAQLKVELWPEGVAC